MPATAAQVAPRPVASASTGPAGGANGQQQATVATTERGIIPLGGSQPERGDQGQDPTNPDRDAARASRQSRHGSADIIEGGFGTGEPPGNIIENLAAGVERSSEPGSGTQPNGGAATEGQQPGGHDNAQRVPLPTPAELFARVQQIQQEAARAIPQDIAQLGEENAAQVQQAAAEGARDAVVAQLRDILARSGGDALVQQLGTDHAELRSLIDAARRPQRAPEQATGRPRPAENTAGTQATSSEATTGVDVNKLAEPIAQIIREQDFAVAAARKAGEGVEAAQAARRKAIQEAMTNALSGLTPEQQADFVLNQLNGRLSQADAENRIDSQRGRFVRGAFREMRFHFSKGRQEIRDLYKFINENPASMQGALIDAIAHGNGIHDTETEERMGNILLHIHNRNMGPVKRLLTEIPGMAGIARRFTTRKEMQKIAELQLQALSGQMSDKDLEKYKKGPLMWRLLSAVLGVVSPVALQAVSDATTQEAQSQGQG